MTRLNTNGTLDVMFVGCTACGYRTIVIQPDGKIIGGGISRRNTDGTIDGSFNPGNVNYTVYTSAIQADGKIIIGGYFTTYNGIGRNRIARLFGEPCLTPTVNLSIINPNCFGSSTGSINASVGGGTAPYTYFWSPSGEITQNLTNKTAGSYTLLVTDNLGCSTATSTILSSPAAIISSVTANQTICNGSSAALAVTPTSTLSALTYTWVSSGNSLNNTNSTSVIATPSVTEIYTISVSDGTCIQTKTLSVVVNALPTISVNSGTICSNESFTITPSGANTYSYSGGSSVVSPTGNTNYTVIGTDLNSCSNTAISTVSVNVIPTLSISPAPELNCLNSVVGVTCTATGTFAWTGAGIISGANSNIANVTLPGIYSVTVTDVNSCSNAGTISVNSNTIFPMFSLSSTALSICEGDAIGISANVTGTNSVSYLWDNSATSQSISVSPTLPTSYTATVTDNVNGCYSTNTITINVYALPNFTITGTNTVCIGTSTAFMANGAMAYTWSTGQGTSLIYVNPTVTTTYSVSGTDMNGCINSQTITLTVDNTCADVWPGDANSDGMADNLDVLELGLHYIQTGAPRATTSNNWQSYFANNWTGTITNGKNLNHSDCNGDGAINDDDTLAIYNNYGLTHSFKTVQTTTVNPQLSIVPDQAMVVKGMWGTSSVYLGDVATNISNINGVAFTIDFDNTLIEPNSIYIEYQNSFIDASQNLYFRKLDFANAKLFTATTHTVSNNVSGFGKIATLHYQIKSSLTTDEVLNIGLSQANQSNASGIVSPLTSGTGTLMAIGASVGIKESLMSTDVQISPNPTNGILNVNFNTFPQNAKIEVYNSIGALVLTETAANKSNSINLSDLSCGIYFMKVLEGNRIVEARKVVKE